MLVLLEAHKRFIAVRLKIQSGHFDNVLLRHLPLLHVAQMHDIIVLHCHALPEF